MFSCPACAFPERKKTRPCVTVRNLHPLETACPAPACQAFLGASLFLLMTRSGAGGGRGITKCSLFQYSFSKFPLFQSRKKKYYSVENFIIPKKPKIITLLFHRKKFLHSSSIVPLPSLFVYLTLESFRNYPA